MKPNQASVLLLLDQRVNTPPIAVATASPNPASTNLDVITLTGTASSDPDGTIASYLWERVSGDFPGVFANAAAGVTTFTPSAFTPASIPSLASWYKADALSLTEGAAVSSWADSKGTKTMTQATAAKQPVYRAAVTGLNNKPAVQFDGVDDLLAAGAPLTTVADGWTMVLVVLPTAVVANGCAPFTNGDGAGGGYSVGVATPNGNKGYLRNGVAWEDTTSVKATTAQAITVRKPTGAGVEMWLGSAALTITATGAPNTPSIDAFLGVHATANAAFLPGYIAEALHFSSAITVAERTDLFNYLLPKYGLT